MSDCSYLNLTRLWRQGRQVVADIHVFKVVPGTSYHLDIATVTLFSVPLELQWYVLRSILGCKCVCLQHVWGVHLGTQLRLLYASLRTNVHNPVGSTSSSYFDNDRVYPCLIAPSRSWWAVHCHADANLSTAHQDVRIWQAANQSVLQDVCVGSPAPRKGRTLSVQWRIIKSHFQKESWCVCVCNLRCYTLLLFFFVMCSSTWSIIPSSSVMSALPNSAMFLSPNLIRQCLTIQSWPWHSGHGASAMNWSARFFLHLVSFHHRLKRYLMILSK